MDQKINAYLESLVLEILQIPQFAKLPDEQKNTVAQKIREYLNGTIIDMVIDRLTPEQLNAIKDLPARSPEMEDKIEEFTSTMPLLAQDMEGKINQTVSDIKQNPQLLNPQ